MFRMEFQGAALDAVEEDDEPSITHVGHGGKSVYEQYRPRAAEERRNSPPKVYEGRVGKFGIMQRIASSNEAVHSVSHIPPVMTRSLSSSGGSVPKNWVEVDLIDFGSPKAAAVPQTGESQPVQAAVDQEILRDLVKPFAESVNVTHQPSGKNVENDVFVTYLEYQPSQNAQGRDLLSDGVEGVEALSGSFRSVESLQASSNSMRSTSSTSWSDSSDAEGSSCHGSSGERLHIKDEEKGSPAAKAYNRAFSKLMSKKNKPAVPEAKFVKPWEEPLLAVHAQLKSEHKLQKLARMEAKRLAEEEKKDSENRKRELFNLANPVPESALRNKKDLYDMRKGIHKLFGTNSNANSPKEVLGAADARDSKLVMPRASIFETCMSPASTDVAFAHIRSGPRPSMKKDIQFATVESNQRDVEAWTMEEYMAKNARLPEWERRENDEEFGGIEGNQLMNQHFDDDVTNNCDSDSD